MITTQIFYKFEINKITNIVESLFVEFKLNDINKKKDSYTNSDFYYVNNKNYYKQGMLNIVKGTNYYYDIDELDYMIEKLTYDSSKNISKNICKYVFNEDELSVVKEGDTTNIKGTYIDCSNHFKTYIENLHTFSKKDTTFTTIKDNHILIMDWFVSLSNKGIKDLNLIEAIQLSEINEPDMYEDSLNGIINYINTSYKY